MQLHVCPMGTVGYLEALGIQEKLLVLRQQQRVGDLLLLLEHPAIITLGKKSSATNILASPTWLVKKGVEIQSTNRGGDVTYHGPGQLVGYPILDLANYGKDIRNFVRNVEEIFIQLLYNEYNIIATRDQKHTGVWVENQKITAIGFAIKRWVSMHGFAFNIYPDLSHFKWINPCGITDKGVTSLQALVGYDLDWQKINQQVVHYFCQVFGLAAQWITVPELNNVIKEHEYASP